MQIPCTYKHDLKTLVYKTGWLLGVDRTRAMIADSDGWIITVPLSNGIRVVLTNTQEPATGRTQELKAKDG